MDIFKVQLRVVRAIELALLEEPRPSRSLHGAASWLACGLHLEEAITSLHMDRKDIREQASELKKLAMACRADRISSEQSGFIMDAMIYFKLHLEAGSNTSTSESIQPTVFLDANSEQDYASDDGADILGCYQELHKEDLAVQTVAFSQNAQEHHGTHLPWFWSIDILQDTESKSWMSEYFEQKNGIRYRWEAALLELLGCSVMQQGRG
ncbi:hypothetical protein BKA82DRAFT_4016029 [Pisolithus tinctorius]|nr:hypothetical protein BKA82DRAFT_4016029 [Pisolithus tinctorius]